MALMTGRSAFLDIVKQEGVSYLFGNPGTTELPIMDALVEHPELKYVLGLHEGTVVTMAEGYARASGNLAVVNVHVAPGLGNAMGALYGAKRARVPMIVSAGQQEQGLSVTEPMLHDALVPMAAPLVKWATELTRVEDLPRVLRRAAKVALTPPMGPVFISLPGDVLNAQAELDTGQSTRVDTAVLPAPRALEQLAGRLLEAASPLIVAGPEVGVGGAMEELAEVASLLGARVYTASVSHTAAFPSRHPLFMGELTRVQPRMRSVLEPADLLLAAGADVFTLSVPHAVDPMPEGLPIVQIGLNDWELGKNYPAEIAIRADVKLTLGALAEVLKARRSPAQAQAAEQRTAAVAAENWSAGRERRLEALEAAKAATPIDPEYLMACVSRVLPENGVVVDEGITSARDLQNHLEIADPKRYFGLCGGGIGWGLPGAVGVKLGLPERPVVCISGDGSAMYSIQALWSAAHEKLPIAFVICNNGSYRILKERLFAFGGAAVARETFIGMDLDHPPIDFVSLAGSLGVQAKRVTAPEDVESALEEALAAEQPMLLDVHVTRGFKP